MDSRNKKITSLNREIGTFLNTHSKKGLPQATQLQKAWEKAATPNALQHTDNITFSSKAKEPTVLVYVENSHWAAELEAQKELYRILLEKETGFSIPALQFLVTRKSFFKKTFMKDNRETKAKQQNEQESRLTEDEIGYAREMVSKIQDKELKMKLYNAIKADFQWKKGTDGLKLPENPPESPETI